MLFLKVLSCHATLELDMSKNWREPNFALLLWRQLLRASYIFAHVIFHQTLLLFKRSIAPVTRCSCGFWRCCLGTPRYNGCWTWTRNGREPKFALLLWWQSVIPILLNIENWKFLTLLLWQQFPRAPYILNTLVMTTAGHKNNSLHLCCLVLDILLLLPGWLQQWLQQLWWWW